MALDLSQIRRSTVAERDYWIDQLVMEVKRLRAIPDEVLAANDESIDLDWNAGAYLALGEVKRRMEEPSAAELDNFRKHYGI